MERFKLTRLQSIWGNRCNSEPYPKWLFLPLNQRVVGSLSVLKHFAAGFRAWSVMKVAAYCPLDVQ